jgi:hypothetical protein
MSLPSQEEVVRFMSKESEPYKFEFVEDVQPLRISIERKTIYVNREVLMNAIKSLINAGLDWKEIMRKNLMHEKAHEKYYKWNRKWKTPAADYGWLVSFLIDIVIDKICFKDNEEYQKWLLLDYCQAFRSIRKRLWKRFPLIDIRPKSLYNQAAYWVALGVISLDEAADLYPEKADYIAEISELFKRIESEEDLEWAFPEAKKIYLRMTTSKSSGSV